MSIRLTVNGDEREVTSEPDKPLPWVLREDLRLTGAKPGSGIAINPSIVETQMVGDLGFGLSAAMFEEITLREGGEVVQSNDDRYRIVRNAEMPPLEVSIIASTIDPTGIGGPGTPPLAPAVGNALRALTGKTPRRLPFVPM